ncbi:MAG: 4'-phosphopantetheinyl transferase superfamily protein [Deltaproteobacteria bacterium]|nr:4'-phosphopantetheinyl transferase superfamily protein [Deltaproteobacteria bacterium]
MEDRREKDNAAVWIWGALESPFPDGVEFSMACQPDRPAGTGHRQALLPEEAALLKPDVHPRRRLEFTLGRSCARQALAGLDPALGTRPLLRDGPRKPRWPGGIVGAIAHAGGAAAAACGPESVFLGLGLDMEMLREPREALRKKVLRPEELPLAAGPGDHRTVDFMLRFSAKESIFKALNPLSGIFLGFQAALVELPAEVENSTGGTFTWRLFRDCGPGFPAGFIGRGGFRRAGSGILCGVWLREP